MGGQNSCFSSTHLDAGAVHAGGKMGTGGDIDSAVLAATQIGGGAGLKNTVNLSFQCHDLPNMDTMSLSDPFCILYKQTGRVWTKLGQTEIIHDNLNPTWVKTIACEYHFEQQEQFKVEVYDVDDDKQVHNLSAHDFIGKIEFELHQVVTSRDQKMTRPLINPNLKHKGTISVTAEEQQANANAEMVKFTPEAILQNTSGLNFFIVYKNLGPNHWIPVYKSEIKNGNGNRFKWNQVQIGATDLCKDNIENEIKIEFFRSQTSGKHKNVGVCTGITLAQLKANTTQYNLQRSAGSLTFLELGISRRHTFLEYIFGGCEIDLSMAIDFTMSNGVPTDPQSLHNLNPNQNQYIKVIKSVGNILQFYNSSKQIQLHGFGGALPPYNQRGSHCFALNGDIFDPRVNGLDQVQNYYQNALKTINLYGPTHFADILKEVVSKAEQENVNQINQKFFVQLIITDGIINDMQKSIDEIVRGSSLPMAIIIVGVGDAEFDNMEKLDGDDEALYSSGLRKYCEADIVQFVPFNQFKNNPSLLAKETLQELPGQLLNFMRKQGINPNPRTEMQRRQLQQQLSMGARLQQGNIPAYYQNKKEKFMQQLQEMGFDLYQVQDWIAKNGLAEANPEVIMDQLQNPSYINVLKMQQQQAMPFWNPAQMQQQMVQPQMQQQQQPYAQPVMQGQMPQGQMVMGVGQPVQQQQPGAGGQYAYHDPNKQY